MEKISKHLSYAEVVKSATAIKRGINNSPNEKELANIKMLAEKVFEPTREHFGKPIGLISGFRSLVLNNAVGGAKSSQHLAGAFNGKEEAAFDIDADVFDNGITNTDIFNYIKDNLSYDQIIAEFYDNGQPAWIHVSYRKDRARKSTLIAMKVNGKTKYVPYSKAEYSKYYGK